MKTKPFDPYEFSKKIIKGVPVYYKTVDSSPCVFVQISFNVGCSNDPKEIVGLSHFLEHMIFDGSPKIPNKKAVEEWSRVNTFKSWNAWTSRTDTTYHLRCLPEKIDTILDGMEDMIFHPLLRAEDVEHERSVITQEAWGRYKNDKYLKYRKEITKNFFHGTTMEDCDSPLGWPETVAKISREEVAQWHKKNYGRGNFFMVVGGAINDKTLHKIEKFLERIPKAKEINRSKSVFKKPLNSHVVKTGDEIGQIKEQAEVAFERILPVEKNFDEETNSMLAELTYDLLFERLRTERALCYSVHIESFTSPLYVAWAAGLRVDEKNIEVVKKEFRRALQDIIKGKEKARFETLKKMRIERLKAAEEVTEDIAYHAINQLRNKGKITPRKESMRKRVKVTYADVVACLKQAFDAKWTVTEVILPSKK